ncbi:MAG: DUF3102 domain-containing protein [Bosea sp. (in: a-proteobacteria)]
MFAVKSLSEVKITAAELEGAAQKIKRLRLAATEHAIEIGSELLRIKEKLPHGAFVKWVERACEFKIRTAQDLMKLAREAGPEAKLVALMVPSTLRVYLSKKTPPALRQSILRRLENGERVSRSSLYSQASEINAVSEPGTRAAEACALHREDSPSAFMTLGLPCDGGERHGAVSTDRARIVAGILLRHLTPRDHALIMGEIDWEVWNRVLVWMRSAQAVDPTRSAITLPTTPAAQAVEPMAAKLQ